MIRNRYIGLFRLLFLSFTLFIFLLLLLLTVIRIIDDNNKVSPPPPPPPSFLRSDQSTYDKSHALKKALLNGLVLFF
jgi:hypothetical protein